MLCALIMAGGKGTRFWPLSTEEKPKQFLNLIGERTMIQMTIDRILPIIPIERVFVCTGKQYVQLVKEQLPNLPNENIIIEPEGRNTAPCITLSSLIIQRYYKNSKMLVLPADHLIGDEVEFRNTIKSSEKFLEVNSNAIVTLGMSPTRAETGYGYIKYSNESISVENHQFTKVSKFTEKPNKERAEEYIKEKTYLWNGGVFIWNSLNIIEQVKKYIPNTYEALFNIENVEKEKLQELINSNYRNTDNISVDYAILEKSSDVYVVPSEFGWDDIGTWASLERYRNKDKNNNISNEKSILIESKNNVILNGSKKIVTIGIENSMIIEENDTIYIIDKNYIDNISEFKSQV